MKNPDALTCDMAETYGVFNFSSIPLRLLATLASGLGPDSRSVMAMEGRKISTQTMLEAIIADRLEVLIWQQTEDGYKGKNYPKSIYERLMGIEDKSKEENKIEHLPFDTIEEFEAMRQKVFYGGAEK